MDGIELIEAILADIGRTLRAVEPEQIDTMEAALMAAERIFVAGKGRSGLQMRAFAMRLMQLGFRVHVVDEVTTPAIGAGDLLLIGSASGRTASLAAYVEAARAAGASLAAFSGDRESPIAQAADTLVHIPASNFKAGRSRGDGAVLVMGSLFEHSLGLLCEMLIIQLKAALQQPEAAMRARHANLE